MNFVISMMSSDSEVDTMLAASVTMFDAEKPEGTYKLNLKNTHDRIVL